MGRAIRLAKAERDVLSKWLPAIIDNEELPKKERAAAGSLLEKLNASTEVKPAGIGAAAAIESFRSVLGSRLIEPPRGALGIFAQMSCRIRDLGLTRDNCVEIARIAGGEWRGSIKAESLVRQADRLLHADSPGAPNRRDELGDMEEL